MESPDLHAGLPTVLVLASGRGLRFAASGGSVPKLQADLAGRTVLQRVLDAVQASGLPYHLENSQQSGMGDSIAAAVRATPNAAGWLILPGDLPLIQSATLRAIAQALAQADADADACVVLPRYAGQRGHPVGFSRRCAPALLDLHGEQGALSVTRRYAVREVSVSDPGCVTDIDTVADLERARRHLAAGG